MSIFERLEAGIVSQSTEETQKVASLFGVEFPANQVLKLSGSLGTGKTTFIKGLAKGWGITESVKSPTFNLYSIYSGNRQLVHLDAYRLNDPSEAEDLLIEEFLTPPYCLAIEWPEKVAGWMDDDSWTLKFKIDSNNQHRIELTSRS